MTKEGLFKKRINHNTKDKGTIHTYCVDKPILLDWIGEAHKQFQEACSLQDYLILVKRWFGKSE